MNDDGKQSSDPYKNQHREKPKIGKFTNIQSGTMIHGLHDFGTIIGEYNTIGHNSVIHGCTLNDFVDGLPGTVLIGRFSL